MGQRGTDGGNDNIPNGGKTYQKGDDNVVSDEWVCVRRRGRWLMKFQKKKMYPLWKSKPKAKTN